MKHSRDQHQIVYHYADGVADILGLSTAQQLAIRTAMHLALRELAAEYDATTGDMATQISLLQYELSQAVRSQEQAASEQLSTLLATISTSQAPVVPVVISANGTHPSSISIGLTDYQVSPQAPAFNAVAAHEAAAATETQPDPTTPAPAGENRRPAVYKWPTLDDVSLEIVQALERKRRQWQSVTPDDKRIIALAVITELQLDLAPGETLSIETFNRHRPRWMPTFPSVSTTLGMTWIQMRTAATHV